MKNNMSEEASTFSRDEIIVATGAVLYAVAAADGVVTEPEIKTIVAEMTRRAGEKVRAAEENLALAQALAENRELLGASLRALAATLPEHNRKAIVEIAGRVAKADGRFDPAEYRQLVKIAECLL